MCVCVCGYACRCVRVRQRILVCPGQRGGGEDTQCACVVVCVLVVSNRVYEKS